MNEFYFKFIPDPFRSDYHMMAFVRHSDDTSIGWINAAGECNLDLGKVQQRDFPIVVKMLKSIYPIYRELLKIDDYE